MGGWRDVTEGDLCGSGFGQTYIFSSEYILLSSVERAGEKDIWQMCALVG